MAGEEKELSFERGLVEMYRERGEGYLNGLNLTTRRVEVGVPRLPDEAKPVEVGVVPAVVAIEKGKE